MRRYCKRQLVYGIKGLSFQSGFPLERVSQEMISPYVNRWPLMKQKDSSRKYLKKGKKTMTDHRISSHSQNYYYVIVTSMPQLVLFSKLSMLATGLQQHSARQKLPTPSPGPLEDIRDQGAVLLRVLVG